MTDAEVQVRQWREWARQWATWPGPPLPASVPLTDDLLRQLIASRVEAAATSADGGAAPAPPRAAEARTLEEHRARLAEDPLRHDSWHALFTHYHAEGQLDAAYCVARALVFLEQATPEEIRLHEELHRPAFRQARQRLTEEVLRRHVFHPDEDLGLTGVFGLVAPAVAAWRVRPLPAHLRPRERLDIAAERTLVSRLVKYVLDVLNVGPPDLYLVDDEPGGASLLNAQRDGYVHPTMLVGRQLLAGDDQRPLAFALGRCMLDLYLPHYTLVALDRSRPDLELVHQACRRMADLPFDGPREVEAAARELLSRLPNSARGQLRAVFERVAESGKTLDVERWARGAELTACRIGLLLCDDLGVAARSITREPTRPGSSLAPRDKIRELVLYSISEDYFAARRSIGLTAA